MKKFKEYVFAFVSSKNSYESMTFANKIVMTCVTALTLIAAVLNIAVFLFFSSFIVADMLINSAILLLFAALFVTIDRFVQSEYIKYDIYNVSFCALIAFTVLRYYTQIGPAVWTSAFLFILLSILRNNRRMIAALSVTVLALGIYVWASGRQFTPGLPYYIIQFVIFAAIIIVGSGILYINLERYKKTSHFLNESEMVAQISSDLISVNQENLREKICRILEKTSAYYGVERSIIFIQSKEGKTIRLTYEWTSGVHITPDEAAIEFSVADSPAWLEQMAHKTVWVLPNVDDPEMTEDQDIGILRSMKIKALISAPIMVKDKVYGSLVYESHSAYRDWKEEHRKMLVVITNLLGDAFTKVEAENEINRMAYFDMLTGIPNRFYFDQQLTEAVNAARVHLKPLAVMFIDLDSFKAVNDAVGHEGGDELLRLVGRRLSERLEGRGIVGRQSGDEFIVLIPDIGESDIKAFADSVMAVFSQNYTVGTQDFFITASAGIAVYPFDGEDVSTLKKNADLTMYEAKELGKNQAAVCTPKLKEDIEQKVRITNLLYKSLEKQELVVHYQPIVDVTSKEIIGFEALLRWYSAELGTVSPGLFIPLAEQTGLILPIGYWVLHEACRQGKAWQDAGFKPVRMAVNLSVEQFRRTDVVDMVKRVLGETGFNPKYLELEITESVAARELSDICGILEAIKELGISISIDDFGTEYSSLARIKKLPFDKIKLAMEFVHGIAVSDKDEAIAKVIINLANNLGLKVVAEGVETEYQFEFLKNRSCDEVQGYYFYKPMPAAEAEMVLETKCSKIINQK